MKFFVVISIFIFTKAFSQIAEKTFANQFSIKPFERKAFIENKGQFDYVIPKEKQNFKYCIDKNYQLFFYQNSISYRFQKRIARKHKLNDVFKSEEALEELNRLYTTETQFINVEWVNSNANVKIEVSEKSPTIYTYVLQDKQGKNYTEMCHGYEKLVYKNIYDNIDVEYIFHPTEGIKYNIIAHKGADLSKVKLKYTGQKDISIHNNELHIETIVGDIIEKQPISYFINTPQQSIASSYNLQNNILSFNLNSNEKDDIVIDPWVVVPNVTANKAYDNGVDAQGNIYVYGGDATSLIAEKYGSSGGVAIWSLNYTYTSGYAGLYYGDLLVESAGSFYISQGANSVTGAKTLKFATNSSLIWTSTGDPDFREHWRLALDCKHGKVIVAGGGTTFPTKNIAEINTTTGVLSNVKSMYNSTSTIYDMAGLCVEPSGNCFLISASGSGNKELIFTNNLLSPISKVTSGHPLNEAFNGYLAPFNSNGFNCMALSGANLLYTFDGSKLKKWNRVTQTRIDSVYITAGSFAGNSGVLADDCGNIFVGSSNGVYRYNTSLVQQEFQATPSSVYDIAFAPNGDIIACGDGFITNLTFTIPPCILKANPVIGSICGNSNNGFIALHVTGGVPTYNYVWTKNGNPFAATTDSIGNLTIGTYKCVFNDSPCNNPHKDSVTITIAAGTMPSASFTANSVCLSSVTQFSNTSSIVNTSSITNVYWDFESDGIIDTTINNPSYTYSATGTHTVTIKVKSNDGCTDSIKQLVNVYPIPIVGFTSDTVCLGNITQMQGLITSGANYAWDFTNDNIPDITGVSTATFTFPQSGTTSVTYSVSVTPTSGLTCSNDTSLTILVRSLPQASFVTTNTCINTPSNYFDASLSSSPSGSITSYQWFWGDGNSTISALSNLSYTYANTGVYTATLLITNSKGCFAKSTSSVEIYPKAQMNILNSPSCFGAGTSFSAVTISYSVVVNQWLWDIDNNSSTIEYTNPINSHTFNSAGSQTIQLISITNHNCMDTIQKVIFINHIPAPQFSVDVPSGCPIHCVNLFDASPSVPLPEHITSWAWDFGNGLTNTVTTNPSQQACYNNTSTNQITFFNVSLTLTTDSGCVATINKANFISVYPKPVAAYIITPDWGNVVVPQIVFTNQSTDYIKSYWDFGDGTAIDSLNLNPVHSYSAIEVALYNSSLIVVNQYGCEDTANAFVNITPEFVFYIPNTFSPNGDNVNDLFTGVGLGVVEYNMWIFNRWGEMIYYCDDIHSGWNGKKNGQECQQDVYNWKVELKDVFNKKHNYVGHVILLK